MLICILIPEIGIIKKQNFYLNIYWSILQHFKAWCSVKVIYLWTETGYAYLYYSSKYKIAILNMCTVMSTLISFVTRDKWKKWVQRSPGSPHDTFQKYKLLILNILLLCSWGWTTPIFPHISTPLYVKNNN